MRHFTFLFLAVLPTLLASGEDPKILEFAGPTMGTRYMVKIFDPSTMEKPFSDVRFEVDGVLRRINDQMSTYLEHSEVTLFNRSDSTEWVDVSNQTATVVQFAQQVSEITGGAFDITVGPLVNAWSFGPDPRTRTVPDQAKLVELKERIGYQKLSVRLDPAALRKSHPDLNIDLSAIAKGYAVDKVVEHLNALGAKNVFVEIGGEVRTSGNKAGQWWKVGIQLPDAASDTVMVAHALSTGGGDDQSMATSGDYRNYFEQDGVRYSHTIDPTTGWPIRHNLASVSVVTESCMAADAWATAINVLGPEKGLELARSQKLDSLLTVRSDDGFVIRGTGTLSKYATDGSGGEIAGASSAKNGDAEANNAGNDVAAVMMITFIAFALLLFAMAVGVMFGRRSISGSCGGLANTKNEDGSVSCSLCSNPADACKELRERMENKSSVG